MARDKEQERERDIQRLDAALDRIADILAGRAPRDSHPTFIDALEGAQLKAIDRIVPLLERRAKLLGLDATQNEQPPGESVLERMQREISAGGKNGMAKS